MKEFVVSVDTMVSVKAENEEQAIRLAQEEFIRQWHEGYIQMAIEEENEI